MYADFKLSIVIPENRAVHFQASDSYLKIHEFDLQQFALNIYLQCR